MSKIDTILRQIDGLENGGKDLCRNLVAHYESELEGMTAHLGQVYEELMLLYDIGDEIASSLDTTVIADRAVARIGELLDAGRGVVVLAANDAEDPHATEVVGSEAVPKDLAALLEWATRQAVSKDRAVIVNDLDDEEAPPADGVSTLVSAPLRARARVIGAIHVLNKSGERGFNTEDQMLLQAIASQIGVAIENSRLFRSEQAHAQELAGMLEELELTYDDTLEALSGALDLRDNETEGHARRVTRYTVRIANELGVEGRQLVDIERGALLHDIGKIGVPDAILLKPGKLTPEEWAVMRQHPVLGYAMIRNIRFLAGAAPVVLHHHERHDGQGGYPSGLKGNDIPIGARLFAVADTFDAMTSDRPYRKALPYDVAREEIERCAATQFDPAVVAAFCQIPPEEWDAIRARVERELQLKRRQVDEIKIVA